MTVSARQKNSSRLGLSPSGSLEDIHLNLAQEVTLAMNSSQSSSTSAPPAILFGENTTLRLNRGRTSRPAHRQRNREPRIASTISKAPAPVKIQTRAPVVKPSPAEEELVRRIHRKVGGPSKLSTYDDPAKVRHVVIEALAVEQASSLDANRIRKGQLTVFERRVVRTVTNRGAAVRSRMRQRKEVSHLKHELRLRESRVCQLENMVRNLCAQFDAPLPWTFTSPGIEVSDHRAPQADGDTEAETCSAESSPIPKENARDHEGANVPDFALDQELFGNIVDQVISHPNWC